MHETLKGALGLSVAVAVAAVPLAVFYDDWNPEPTKIRGVPPDGVTLAEGEELVFQLKTRQPEQLTVTFGGELMNVSLSGPDDAGWYLVRAHPAEPMTRGWVRVSSCKGCPADAIIPLHYRHSFRVEPPQVGVAVYQSALSGDGEDNLSATLSRALNKFIGPVRGLVPCVDLGPADLNVFWTGAGVGASATLWDPHRKSALAQADVGVKLMATGGDVMTFVDNRATSLELNLTKPNDDSLLCGALDFVFDNSAKLKRLLSEPMVRKLQALLQRALHLGELVELPNTRVDEFHFKAERWGYVALTPSDQLIASPVAPVPAPAPRPSSGQAAATIDVHLDTLNHHIAVQASALQARFDGQVLGDKAIVKSCAAGTTPPYLSPRHHDTPELVVEGWRCTLADTEGQDAGVVWISARLPIVWDQLLGPVMRVDAEAAELALSCQSNTPEGDSWSSCPEAFTTASQDQLKRSALANARLPLERFLPAGFKGAQLVMPEPSGQWIRLKAQRLDWDSLLIEFVTSD